LGSGSGESTEVGYRQACRPSEAGEAAHASPSSPACPRQKKPTEVGAVGDPAPVEAGGRGWNLRDRSLVQVDREPQTTGERVLAFGSAASGSSPLLTSEASCVRRAALAAKSLRSTRYPGAVG
jgi:hypothetical protein